MAARNRVLLGAIVILSLTLAGCAKPDTRDPQTVPAPDRNGNTGGNGGTAPPPTDFDLADQGDIQGTFDKSWDIPVANVAFRDAHLTFTLAGLAPGTPPTARVHLTLLDPNGVPVQTGAIGLGAETNSLDWTLTPAQLSMAGTYTLQATAAQEAPLPSAGFGAYTLAAHIGY